MINHSNNFKLGQDNQQERLAKLSISDDYLIGFAEGEGCFYVGVVPSKETLTGWQVIYYFKVSQNPAGKIVLEHFCSRLGCGYLKANSLTDETDKSLAFVVRDFKSLKSKVIPFFEGKLVTNKRNDFDKFKRVLEIVDSRSHLNREGMSEILELMYSMNTQRRKFDRQMILSKFS